MRFLLLSVVLLASGCSTLITQEPSGSGEAKSVFQYELGREYRTENEGPAHIVTCSKAPLLPSEARARLAQVHKGMQRADVERILGPQENGIALSTSGLLSDYYLLTPDVRVRVDYMLQNVSSARYSEHDVVVRKPDTLSVKTEPEGQNRIRWVNVPVPQVE
jgi:hypothetical protein